MRMPAAVAPAIGAGLSAVKTSFDLIKSLRELLTKPDVIPAEVHARLLEIEGLLLDARSSLADAEDENRKLRGRIQELERCADFGNDFTFEQGVYWRLDYPYCPNCWDAERKPTRLDGPFATYSDTHAKWDCAIHKSTYSLKNRGAHC